jgi:dihydroorotase
MEISLLRPDDWHVHLRDGAALGTTVPATAAQFARAIVMPNLKPPVTTVGAAQAYRSRILEAVPAGVRFEPLMTLYLTDNTPAQEIDRAKASGVIHGVKLYPAGATTHSDAGVTDLTKVYGVLERMERLGVILQVHGEATDPSVDVFDREAVFLETQLAPLLARFPGLRVVVEHITTQQAVQFVQQASPHVAATITAHHLLYSRNAMFGGGIRPHFYCLPVLKREQHRQALVQAATGDNSRFFLGTDSAPHPKSAKETSCGCAGIYTAHAAMELYAEVFDAAGALTRLEDFACRRGPAFYGVAPNADRITLRREPWTVPQSYELGGEQLVPLRAGAGVAWRLHSA